MPSVKRYLLFVFDLFAPGGGWTDFAGSFDAVDDARHAYATAPDTARQSPAPELVVRRPSGGHIVDATTGEIVANLY